MKKMDLEMKCLLCDLRLDGATIYEIASRINRTPQGVQRFISLLPKGDNPELALESFPRSLCKQVCRRYLETRSIMTVAMDFDLSTDDVEDILAILSLRPPSKVNRTYYPMVADWMLSNGYSVKRFAKAVGLKEGTLRSVLNGTQGMRFSYAAAEKISNFTGLKFSEIFQVQLENMDPSEKDFKKIRRELKAKKKATTATAGEKRVKKDLKKEEGATRG